jgi:hypothetical protein
MRRPVFVTLSQLSRVRGIDPRNRILRELSPAAFLLAGEKRHALFELSDGDVAETANLTDRIPNPPQSIV